MPRRPRLEESYGAAVHMAYGLNEIGKVATRCNAGRYHVNTEQCLVQIARDDGSPCAPGEVGEITVRAPFMTSGYWKRPDLTQEAFTAADTDGNGELSQAEFEALLAANPVPRLTRRSLRESKLSMRKSF